MAQFPEEPLHLTASEGFGYFPGYPGQKLNKGQYEITRKIGYGPRSSLWLALDSCNDKLYSLIKVLTAHETLHKPPQELNALKVEGNLVDDHFEEDSHHGTHLCLSLVISGLSCEHLRLSSPTKSLSRHIVQRAVACVLEELVHWHKNDIIHGAVTESNIASSISIQRADIDPVLAELSPCTIERKITVGDVEYPIVLSTPIPGYIVWDDNKFQVNRNSMTLNNLGHSQKMKDHRKKITVEHTKKMRSKKKKRKHAVVTPPKVIAFTPTEEIVSTPPTWENSRMDRSLRPPEIILGLPYTSKVDVWMLGSTVYHMSTGKPLVPEEKAADDGIMLSWLVAMSGGHVTPALALKSNVTSEYFDENGLFKLRIPEETLESQIIASGVVQADDIPGLVKFVQTCLTLDPADRPSPEDLCDDVWVTPGFDE
ncbi:hypothetical protein M413DRAFT_20917 [Hebeloma cylindrosporum]|uniref:Protein kinase domain-containing protein n=1 Tax=Hebeloma cylindrosporum TaxID=76867 RepID=A0A0C3CWM0_HEBCY|nr:hypothetical protein M413DRAFT_20917 [Hebeloma cylindrosporum h7]